MAQLKDFRDSMIQELSKIYPAKESSRIIDMLFFMVAGIDKKDISFDPGRLVEEPVKILLLKKLEELMDHKPIQYVTGKAYFYDFEIKVDPSVLIPRPETEELVKWVVDDFRNYHSMRILDIGTGSGCIILSLGRFLKDPVLTGIDVSDDALGIAAQNAAAHDITVNFINADILNEIDWDKLGQYDLIVSNPPYVRESEKILMDRNVLDFEPGLALFVTDDDPLIFYRAVARFSRPRLSKKGKLYLEINENLGNQTVALLKEAGFSTITLKKDIRGRDRMISAGL